MDQDSNFTSNSEQQLVGEPSYRKTEVLTHEDPLALEIPDDELVRISKKREEDADKFYQTYYRLRDRRKANELYLFGRQVDQRAKDENWKVYEARYLDNALYEIEASIKPLAMTHLPDMLVLPGSEEEEKQQSARDLSIVIDDVNKNRQNRQVLGLGFKHLPVYFTGVIKAVWNPEIGESGDYQFINVHPEHIILPQSATTNNADDMEFVSECIPTTVQQIVMRFPNKKEEIYKELQVMGVMVGETPSYKELASEVKYYEVYFTWYKRKDTGEVVQDQNLTLLEPGVKWERVEGVLWRLNDMILKKMKNPNFDYEGEQKWFAYDTPQDDSTKREVGVDELMSSIFTGLPITGLTKETIYHNYFKNPRKPYYFFGYDQWGRIPYDETSRIEQNLKNQQNLDIQGKQITETLMTRVKHIWSSNGGLDAQSVQRMDLDDPKIDALVTGDVRQVHGEVRPERPDSAQYEYINATRDRMYGVAGATAIRGQIQSDTATSNQIAREADFTRADDLVEDTINTACEWMADWQMQFIKLRYTEEHLIQRLGAEGTVAFIKIRRDSVADGMEVVIKASSTDKLQAQKNAMEMAKLGPPYSNPKDFFDDMDVNDPEGRLQRGLMFLDDPQGYYVKYGLKLPDTNAQVGALAGMNNEPNTANPVSNPPVGENQGAAVPTLPTQQAAAPQGPTPLNTAAIPTEQPQFPTGSPRGL